MANFFACIDPNPERRSRLINSQRSRIAPFDGLVMQENAAGNFAAIWAANANAPITQATDGEATAVIWGEPIKTDYSGQVDAAQFLASWTLTNNQIPLLNGFYAAIAFHPTQGLCVAADLLGLFPIYYCWIAPDILLIGSSPELFQYHPDAHLQFNPIGLVGILLINNLVNGQTLWQGVRRLKSGHLLTWQLGQAPAEVSQYSTTAVSAAETYTHLPYPEQIELLHTQVQQVIASQVSVQQVHGLLLSGGLDSRTLAGYLHQQGVPVQAITLGNPGDLEASCAVPVAQILNFPHQIAPIPADHYVTGAELTSRWEHLASGFCGLCHWKINPNLQNVPARVVNGIIFDRILMGRAIQGTSLEQSTFARLFAARNAWGFSPPQLQTLLRPSEFAGLVETAIADMEQSYNSYAEVEYKRAWWFDLYHRQRLHVGVMAWQGSFVAWPILPVLDWQLIQLTFSLSSAMLANRWGQSELLCRYFPDLAKLPLDRNGFDTQPLLLSPWQQRFKRWLRLQQKWRRWQNKLGYERRYYYRVMDMNHPGWQAVRSQAEPYRQCLGDWLNLEEVDRLLPAPRETMHFAKDGIIESAGRKLLLGLMLWTRDHR